MATTVNQILHACADEDLVNLGAILGVEVSSLPSADKVTAISEAILWSYFSKVRMYFLHETVGARLVQWIARRDSTPREYQLPPFEQLTAEAAKKVGAFSASASQAELELYLVERMMLSSLLAMTPETRHRVLSTMFAPADIARSASGPPTAAAAPLAALGAMAIAQASGFGVYLAATTTLGLLTHAVGITLPFAAYAGLTSSIAFVIGPVGWLGAGLWAAWTFTETKWDRIVPALIYMISVQARPPN